jgi:uncharacterized repeat protein (TIGR03803 family)
MRRSTVAASRNLFGMLLFALAFLSIGVFAQSPERVLYVFTNPPGSLVCSGRSPLAPLITDASGNLYGTTIVGGVNEVGCVFELFRGEDGGWKEVVLHGFSGPDGYYPSAALVFDKFGNLYGTTEFGGAYNSGVVFKLSPSSDGEWTETVLYSFGNGNDGFGPCSNLIFDKDGNLYGTTLFSKGSQTAGSVYRLSRGPNGWTETLLYVFPTYGSDGYNPNGGLVMDGEGNLYGVTGSGGANGNGTVYELARSADGTYKESVIYSFGLYEGWGPNSGLTIDSKGILYGTTAYSYLYKDSGIVFRLKRDAAGSWTEDILHQMTGRDGSWPLGPVAFDRLGNLYAAASSGGTNGQGSVFELTPTPSGPWKETVLHFFDYTYPSGTDGADPLAGVIVRHGRVFGTTSLGGGPADGGTVFEIKPPTLVPDSSEAEQ